MNVIFLFPQESGTQSYPVLGTLPKEQLDLILSEENGVSLSDERKRFNTGLRNYLKEIRKKNKDRN